jgi:hypothetical protein
MDLAQLLTFLDKLAGPVTGSGNCGLAAWAGAGNCGFGDTK